MLPTKLFDFGPRTAASTSLRAATRSPGYPSGAGLVFGLALAVGCTQDYEINSVEGDEPITTAPSVVTPSTVAPSGTVGPAASTGDTTPSSPIGTGSVLPRDTEANTTGSGATVNSPRFDPSVFAYDRVEPAGDATGALEDPENREREEQFDITSDNRADMVDFLFVVDNSTSMGRIRDLVRSGLVSLYDDDPFPGDSRIAVMSTIPANPADFSQLHPRVNDQGGQAYEPGFLRLVDADGIQRFRKEAPELASAFRFEGCENAWFEPWEENDDGVPCLVAHTQISRTPIRVEAGLSAVQQFLEKRAGESTFREGAAVHVIFVSDTHSPGLSGGQRRLEKTGLEVDPITYSDLQKLVDADNLVSSFKVHAIAPATECVEEWAYLGPRYFNVAEASGGATLDICTAEDYAPFIRSLVEQSDIVDTPILELGRPSAAVHQVLLDGQPVAFETVRDGSAVRLKGLDRATAKRNLTVHYRY
jgi:hypothetical protein